MLSEIARFGAVGVPGAVTALRVSATTNQAVVQWKPPLRSADTVTGYEVELATLGQAKQAEKKREVQSTGKGAETSSLDIATLPEGLQWIRLVACDGTFIIIIFVPLDSLACYSSHIVD